MIITNGPAIFFVLISFALTYLIEWGGRTLFGASTTLDSVTWGLFLFLIVGLDFTWRISFNQETKWKRFVAPRTGAHLFWLPLWLLIAGCWVGSLWW